MPRRHAARLAESLATGPDTLAETPANMIANADPLAVLRYEPLPDLDPEQARQLLSAPVAQPSVEAKKVPARLRPKTTKHKGITRIDHPAKRTFGYFVRVTWNKQRRSKFFSDSVYGDRLAALAAAIEWRNATERELGKPRTERQVIGVSRTSTGIVGVRRTIKDGREVYEATWRDGNRIRRTSYSIAKHGERRALALARRAREKYERMRQRTPAGD
ncbi:AP2/ERF family transcription factor [Chloroflexus sp.]|uniref:AP2/ERF family transcription factor n=1 Tax=Chloroflexus sp. TaxID=1904827 RepID=UPI0026249A7D|nr:AP2/ERF family transcription factor [uncultured Chloroflexus sp.]